MKNTADAVFFTRLFVPQASQSSIIAELNRKFSSRFLRRKSVCGMESIMRIRERIVDTPEKEGVILQYVELTRDFSEIREYVKSKGETIVAYTDKQEMLNIRIEDILYFEAVGGMVFAYTKDAYFEVKRRLYQLEEELRDASILRASKSLLVHMEHIVSVRTALNGRLYAKMENDEEVLITRNYAKQFSKHFAAGGEICFRK